MINDILPRLTTRLTRVKSTGVSCHVHPIVFSSVEKELCQDETYIQKIPEGYPKDMPEQRGYRRLLQPADAVYQNIKLRIGLSKLHIADKETKKNLEAIALFYFSNVESLKIGTARAHALAAISGAYLLENGVVASLYGIGDLVALVSSWYPEGKEGFGGLPYPKTRFDVKDVLERTANSSGVLPQEAIDSNEFKVLPDLVMLCVES